MSSSLASLGLLAVLGFGVYQLSQYKSAPSADTTAPVPVREDFLIQSPGTTIVPKDSVIAAGFVPDVKPTADVMAGKILDTNGNVGGAQYW